VVGQTVEAAGVPLPATLIIPSTDLCRTGTLIGGMPRIHLVFFSGPSRSAVSRQGTTLELLFDPKSKKASEPGAGFVLPVLITEMLFEDAGFRACAEELQGNEDNQKQKQMGITHKEKQSN
jgi:hypothetical protein